MRYIVSCFLVIMTVMITSPAEAITVTATPNPAVAGQTVTINIITPLTVSPPCNIEIDYGEGGGFVPAGTCTFSPCNITRTHTYSTPGTYTIAVRSTSFAGGSCAAPPDPAYTTLVVQCPALAFVSPSGLPRGTAGQAYSYNIQTSGGQPPVTYSVVAGSLPPGLILSPTGSISGTPTSTGNYSFTVSARDSCPTGIQSTDRTFSLTVGYATLTVDTSPSSFSVPRGITSTRLIAYTLRTSPAMDTNLRSNEGQFIASGRVIGRVERSLNVSVRNGTGRTSENITIVPGVLKRAEQLGVTRIRYVRTFSGNYNSATASVYISITTEAGAGFQINRLRLYFENNRAEITVKRNYPSLKAFAEVRFTGSGLLRAYWEVDGRILSYVYKHLVYGRSVVFETPRIPPLPTFDPGTHFLKFVILEPQQEIPLPTAIYYVASEEYRKGLYRISLLSPSENAEIPYRPFTLQWKISRKPALYLVEFFEAGERPVFSAYTKQEKYRVNKRVLRVFARGKSYLWHVKAFDDKTNVVSQSELRKFTFSKPRAYLPRQVIVAFKMDGNEKGLLQVLLRKYQLTIMEKFELPVLRWRIYVFQTEENVSQLVKKLRKESGTVLVQPNYIYNTLSDPLTSFQGISRELRLHEIHGYFKGRNTVVAIIDTGVDATHEDLRDAIRLQENCIESSPYKPEIHGTAIAGIIAARINNFGIEGIAPEAKILALRACRQVSKDNPEGECYSVCLAKAISKAVEQNADIINISAGTKNSDSLVSKLIAASSEHGVILVAPVGNDPSQKSPYFPASHPDVLAVAGTDFQGHFYPNKDLVRHSSVVAPAANIFTTVPGNSHNYVNGTSFSSAIVSGILAVAKEKNKNLVKHDLPPFEGDLCEWEERLLGLSLCGR